MSNPHAVTKQFEAELCAYTGAPFCVTTNSCTMALLLAVAWHLRDNEPIVFPHPKTADEIFRMHRGREREVEIPARTYISVPQSIIHAGGWPTFRHEDWQGWYQLKPLPVWDSARWFTSGLFGKVAWHYPGKSQFVCVSFHASKTLGLEQGGAILHDNPEADAWLRRARFDGRTEGVAPVDDQFDMLGWHCYLNPSTAAQGILRLHSLPRHNAPLPNDPYPDLSTMEIFK